MKKTNSALVVYSLTLISLVSCAGNESYESKMSRYTPKVTGKNQVPDFKTEGFEFTRKNSRMPASVAPQSTEKKVDLSEDATLSNKKLYFLTLFGQYEIMKKFARSFDAPSVNICPHFHSSLLEHNGRKATSAKESLRNDKKFVYDKSKFGDADYVANKAELSLPLSKDESTPKVIDIFRSGKEGITEFKMNEIIHDAMDIHLSKTYSEIRELCEYGVSDNYYVYENLITHIKSNDFKATTANMNTLLKTTIFSNMALVTTLEKKEVMPSRSIASVEEKKMKKSNESITPYANEVMTRLNVGWAKEYFAHLGKSR